MKIAFDKNLERIDYAINEGDFVVDIPELSQLEARIKELESELTSVEDTKEIFRKGFNECTKLLDESEEKLQKAEKVVEELKEEILQTLVAFCNHKGFNRDEPEYRVIEKLIEWFTEMFDDKLNKLGE